MQQRAFSLIELSIVLVILGLLTGGILAGQSLIRAAELRSVSTDINRYSTAVTTFRDKYFAIPGDMTNATAFWGFAAGTNGADATCTNASQTGAGTCNGNGNGRIGWSGATTEYPERFHFWKQLANAGLIEGSFTGAAGGTGSAPTQEPIIGTNIPTTRLSSVGISIYGLTPITATDTNWFIHPYGNIFCLGNKGSNGTCYRAVKPEEAWNIDTKLDDGKPAYGRVLAQPNTNISVPNCADGATSAANYNLTVNSIECPIVVPF